MSLVQLSKSPLGAHLFVAYVSIVHGLRFRIATESDEDALYRFRFKTYREEGYIRAADFPDEKFSDKYDPVSINVIALKGSEIVGTCRVTHYSDLGLPAFDYFNVSLPECIEVGSMVEMGRFMISPDHRGKSRIVSVGMTIPLRNYVREHPTIEWLVAVMSDKVREAFRVFVSFDRLDEAPLQQRHVEARDALPGYWDRTDIHPVHSRASELL